MESVVISLGGSIISTNGLNLKFMEEFVQTIRKLEKRCRFGIVVGGGSLARTYISALREYHVNDNILDEIGINATRMNALALSSFLPDSNSKIPSTVNDAAEFLRIYPFVVMGGTEPGHTTDTVATLLAERIGAKILINATSVDGVYTDDPKKSPNARKLPSLSYDEAISLALEKSIGAGPNVFMDLTALNIAKRAKIKLYVTDGKELTEYENIILHGKTSGTLIS